jgi:hypothetical protein
MPREFGAQDDQTALVEDGPRSRRGGSIRDAPARENRRSPGAHDARSAPTTRESAEPAGARARQEHVRQELDVGSLLRRARRSIGLDAGESPHPRAAAPFRRACSFIAHGADGRRTSARAADVSRRLAAVSTK